MANRKIVRIRVSVGDENHALNTGLPDVADLTHPNTEFISTTTTEQAWEEKSVNFTKMPDENKCQVQIISNINRNQIVLF